MKFSSIFSITLLLSACFFLPTTYGKRSFGVSRRAKTQKSYSARRGDGRNSQPDSHHDPIPKPQAPKSISKTESSHAPSAPAPQPGWNVNNQHPGGAPPAYPGLGHNSAPGHGMPPAYSPSYNKPPAYSQYPQQSYNNAPPAGGMSPYGNMGGYQQPMGGGYQQPMGGYQQPMGGMGVMPYGQPMGGYQQPQRSSGGMSVGGVMAGMAVGGLATHLVGSMIPRRQVSEQHIHHYDHTDKDDSPAAAVPQQPQEGLAPLVTPDPVLLAPNPEMQANQFNQAPEEPQPQPPMEPIYNFNYAPAYVQHTMPPQTPTDQSETETSSAEPTEEDSTSS